MSTSARTRAPSLVRSPRCCTAAVIALLSACTVGPNFVRPPPPPETRYTSGADPTVTVRAAGSAQRFDRGGEVVAGWWRVFKSPQLDALITQALARNANLHAAQAALRESEDDLRAGSGIFYPQVDAAASGARQRFSALRFGQDVPSRLFNLFTLSATVSYALDPFGGERRAIEGLSAQVDLARADRQATDVMLIANVINTVIARAAYQAEIDTTRELVHSQAELVRITEIEVRAGMAPYSSLLSLRSQLSATIATVPQIEQKLAQSQDLLAILVGQPPSAWHDPDIGITDLTLPSDLPVALPSTLVRQRPDILAAEAAAHVASANIGVASAALLPNITLTADAATDSTAANRLFASTGNSWSLGANLAQPLFYGGALWFRRKAALDGYRRSLALYRQTVLDAFAQVADTLQALAHDAQALRAERDALQSSAEALHLVRVNYKAGLAGYLDVLSEAAWI
jgi:NodT family efflux transporter outer membrane factor (OMF) lipoprotein